MSTLPAEYIPQRKVTLASRSGSLGFIVHVKCCRMVDSSVDILLELSFNSAVDVHICSVLYINGFEVEKTPLGFDGW